MYEQSAPIMTAEGAKARNRSGKRTVEKLMFPHRHQLWRARRIPSPPKR